jgi:subfamily B ATP-binding cassette protein MsbA
VTPPTLHPHLRRLARYAKVHWRYVVVLLAALMLLAALEPAIAALMQPLIDKSLIAKDPTSLWRVPLLLAAVFVLKGLGEYVANTAGQTLAHKTVADIRQECFDRIIGLPLRRLDAQEPGRLLSKITYDVNALSETISSAWVSLIRDTLVLLGLLAFLFYQSWQLAILVLFIAPVAAVLIRMVSTRLRSGHAGLQDAHGAMTSFLQEALLGLRELKIFQAEANASQRFSRINRLLRVTQVRVSRLSNINVPLVQMVAAIAVAVVVFFGSRLAAQSELSPGGFLAFVVAVALLFEPVRRLTNVNAVLQRGLAAADSIFELLDEAVEWPSSVATRQEKVRGSPTLEISSLHFRYPERSPIFQDFSLRLMLGESLLLTGPSGSGKSTLLHLIAGFESPMSGRILVEGLEVSCEAPASIRERIALVSQQTFLFNGTIEENILLGRPDATPAEVERAASLAHVSEFCSSLPLGMRTPLGSFGHGLSGGQRQRISVARAFLKDAPLLLLDEPTSALDAESRSVVEDAIGRLMRNRATIFVTHLPVAFSSFTHQIELNATCLRH